MKKIINGYTVSLTHYLNKELFSFLHEGERYYQLYTIVCYKTKTTRFKACDKLEFKGSHRVYVKESHQKFIDMGHVIMVNRDVYLTDKIILRIIEFEITKLGDQFTLKGLGKRLSRYGQEIAKHYTGVNFDEVNLNHIFAIIHSKP